MTNPVGLNSQARAHRAKLLFGLAALGAAAELHGDMTQAARLASLDAFRKVRLESANRCTPLCSSVCQCSAAALRTCFRALSVAFEQA